jgi:uncharacterized protein YoxC
VSEVPTYWWQVTAGAAIVVIVLSVVMIAVCGFLIMALVELRRGIASITGRVETITNRVDSIAKQVEQVTTEVGSRTSGIVRTVDDIAAGAFNVVERYAPLVIGAAAVFKLWSMFKKKK